jgi:SulP family sulfate permease
MGAVPAEFLPKWGAFVANAGSVTPAALMVSGLALAILLVWPRISKQIPGPFVALIVTTVLVTVADLPVETIGSRFGVINPSFPHPQVPHVTVTQLTSLVGPAFAIALLGAIESLLSAVVADGMIGGKHRSNMELVAQGIANVASPMFGGIPATGAIARTATNVKNGGRTPVAGMVHALTLLLITVFFGQYAALIPMATLAAILVVVAYHMSEWRVFLDELRSPKSDVAVLLTTFGLTVLVDLTVAISVGMVLAAFLFMRRMATLSTVRAIGSDDDDVSDGDEPWRQQIPHGVTVFDIDGPFFFGAVATFREALDHLGEHPRVLIIHMRDVPSLDSTGLRALKDVVGRSRRTGSVVLLAEVQPQPRAALEESTVLGDIGADNIYASVDSAIEHARALVTVPK